MLLAVDRSSFPVLEQHGHLQAGADAPPSKGSDDTFGAAAAVYNDVLAVHAPQHDGINGVHRGAVRISSLDADATSSIRQSLVCFVVILSASGRDHQRDGLRKTWLRHRRTDWDYKFFMGGRGDRILLPDVVRLPDVADDYEHLSHKVLGALKWVAASVQTQFVLKVDEDTWVDMRSVTNWLHASGSDWFYGGALQTQLSVMRSGKWGVPTTVFSSANFPPYALGGGYVLSLQAAAAVVQVLEAKQVPLLPNVEDSSIGLAARFLGLAVTPIEGFAERPFLAHSQPTSGCCSAGTMLYHKPSDIRICEQCSSLPHTAATVAICLVGQPRSIALTAPNLRQYLLESTAADAFVVAPTHNLSAEQYQLDREALHDLGPRVRVLRLGSVEELLDARALQQIVDSPAQDRGYVGLSQPSHGGWPQKHAEQWLSRQACADLVHEVESKRGRPYTAYARVRLDTRLFAPIDKALFDSVSEGKEATAIVPEGNEFGADPYVSVDGNEIMHVTDKMLIGDRRAFDADSSIWRTMIDSSVRRYP